MKERKLKIRWLILPVILVILLLLLTMCRGNRSDGPEETLPVMASVPAESSAAAEQTEEATEPSQETTAPTEETTEPAEETTEATTASTESTEAYDPEEETEVEYVEFPDPGTPENPYVEVPEGYPSEVVSVKIPKGKEVSYLISGTAGSVITINEPGVTLTVDGKNYSTDENGGVLTVDLSQLLTDPVITLSQSTKKAAACVLTLTEGLGGAGNPELLTDPAELEVRLLEGDTNGYHYLWNASITGQVELTLKEKDAEVPEEAEEESGENSGETQPAAETPVLEIVVTIGDQVIKLSECDSGKLTFDTVKGQEVLIQVIAQPFADGTYPAIEETILWNLLPALGTAENPVPLESIESIPVTLEEGDAYGRHFQWTATTYGNVTLTADPTNLDVVVTAGESVWKLSDSAEEAVTFHVDKGQTVQIQAVAIPETGEDTEAPVYPEVKGTVTGTIQPDPGTPENPAVLESMETITVTLAEGNVDGYTCQWTAPYGGTLEITSESNDKEFEVLLTNTADTAVQKLSESESGILTVEAEAEDVLVIQVIAIAGEDGTCAAGEIVLKGTFTAAPGSSEENPIVISDPESGATIAMAARQTVYFSGMLHEMVATVENASGVSLHFEDMTSWGDRTGVAELEFPEANTEEPEKPVVFSVTSKNEKELTLTFAYPTGHVRNPGQLALGENEVTLAENQEDGYQLAWTAEDDGQLTITVDGKKGWQYQLNSGEPGQLYTSSQEPVTASQTVAVKTGDRIVLTLWTLAEEESGALPSGKLTVTASFYDPLLGTAAKPIRLETSERTANTVTVPAGKTLYYTADAEGMILTFAGQEVTLTHNGEEHLPEDGTLQILCHGAEPLFRICNPSEKDQTCRLSFAYPQGHMENPAALRMGENTAVLEDSALCGYAFAWTADASGELTVTMDEEASWQYILRNETAGIEGIVYTSEDQPKVISETMEVTKGDRVLIIVNTFDLEHPLKTPAGEVVFTAEFVDPTLGMEENPVWLNLEDQITIPAGKTMYCTAKADGMLLTLTGSHATLTHAGKEYTLDENEITVYCEGTETFGHPVFAITNTGEEAGSYTVSFTYPKGHFMNPAPLQPGEITVKAEEIRKGGQYFLWTAEADGALTFTMNTESGWKYMLANLTTGVVGEIHLSDAEEPAFSETVQVSTGDQIRILVDIPDVEADTVALSCTVSFSPAASEDA